MSELPKEFKDVVDTIKSATGYEFIREPVKTDENFNPHEVAKTVINSTIELQEENERIQIKNGIWSKIKGALIQFSQNTKYDSERAEIINKEFFRQSKSFHKQQKYFTEKFSKKLGIPADSETIKNILKNISYLKTKLTPKLRSLPEDYERVNQIIDLIYENKFPEVLKKISEEYGNPQSHIQHISKPEHRQIEIIINELESLPFPN